MTTPFIPTKIELNLLTYSPEELAGDAALETWLLALRGNDAGGPYSEGLVFVQALMTAHRTAANTAYSSAAGWKTFTFEFTTYGGLTGNQKANYIATALGAGTKYNYTVTGPLGGSSLITISWA